MLTITRCITLCTCITGFPKLRTCTFIFTSHVFVILYSNDEAGKVHVPEFTVNQVQIYLKMSMTNHLVVID